MDNKDNSVMPTFMVQWHVTALCDQTCLHCYMVNNPVLRKNELEKELSFADCKKIIDSLVDFCNIAHARPAINFTGGDPLLRSDFFKMLEYVKFRGVRSSVMGNPFHLNAENILIMKQLGVNSYQVSIDGMERTHDFLRKPGSFFATVEAIQLLKKCGMRTVVMFTLSKMNSSELFDVMRLVDSLGVDAFAFARLARDHFIDTKISPRESDFAPFEYRSFLLTTKNLIEELKARGSKTKFNLKDHLWKLLLYEQGKIELKTGVNYKIVSGCHVGNSHLTILADGTVFACRRLYSPIGKMPGQSVLDVFTSDKLDFYRNVKKFEKCSKCPLLYYCRGCPAVSSGASDGNFYAPDPQCWQFSGS